MPRPMRPGVPAPLRRVPGARSLFRPGRGSGGRRRHLEPAPLFLGAERGRRETEIRRRLSDSDRRHFVTPLGRLRRTLDAG